MIGRPSVRPPIHLSFSSHLYVWLYACCSLCLCVCVSACVCVLVCLCVSVCLCVFVHLSELVCRYVCLFLCVYVHLCVCLIYECLCVCISVRTCISVYVCPYVYLWVCFCVYECLFLCLCLWLCLFLFLFLCLRLSVTGDTIVESSSALPASVTDCWVTDGEWVVDEMRSTCISDSRFNGRHFQAKRCRSWWPLWTVFHYSISVTMPQWLQSSPVTVTLFHYFCYIRLSDGLIVCICMLFISVSVSLSYYLCMFLPKYLVCLSLSHYITLCVRLSFCLWQSACVTLITICLWLSVWLSVCISVYLALVFPLSTISMCSHKLGLLLV